IQNPDLSHSKIAAFLMEKELDIRDEDVLNAVKYHTTGRANMSKLEKVIFLADSIEPGRDYPGIEKIRELSNKDLDAACLSAIENTIEYLHRQDINIDPDTEKAREWLQKTISKKGDLDEQQKNSITCG
ncbi:MAG TPA: bis(5'-nucleosyl)-tetraphosphatase (symmetrical) YqeK, partial [Bacillota bacterium]|nr:bis(5'-nucleosyl)-tetraphosphatase (symmetrical) YqeK [Bacillota bacterium]